MTIGGANHYMEHLRAPNQPPRKKNKKYFTVIIPIGKIGFTLQLII